MEYSDEKLHGCIIQEYKINPEVDVSAGENLRLLKRAIPFFGLSEERELYSMLSNTVKAQASCIKQELHAEVVLFEDTSQQSAEITLAEEGGAATGIDLTLDLKDLTPSDSLEEKGTREEIEQRLEIERTILLPIKRFIK
jgi:hypothetical protein